MTGDVPTWRPVAPLSAPVDVAAASAPQRVDGLAVAATAFATPVAGWAAVGAGGVMRLLYTDDAGNSWTPQLAWNGSLLARLAAFDQRRAALVLVAEHGEVNGAQLGGDRWSPIIASTENAGTTWTLAPVPHPKQLTGASHFLTPRQAWLLRRTSDLPPRVGLVHTDDGGATWSESAAPEGIPFMWAVFPTAAAGLLIAAPTRSDGPGLYITGDHGTSWTRQHLRPPPGVPPTALTSLEPATSTADATLLLLRAGPARESANPRWAGIYAYLGTDAGRTWSGPHKLPMTPTWTSPHLAVLGGDGRVWAASGHDVWTAEHLDASWRHRPAALPADHLIADIAPTGSGVLWLTTTRHPSPGTPPSGLLYRSNDHGAHWIPVQVGSS